MEVSVPRVGKSGDTVVFLLTARRDVAAAQRYLDRVIYQHALPEKITIEKCGANTAAMRNVSGEACVDFELRQSKYLNNMVWHDHRSILRITDPILDFKSIWSAQQLVADI